MSVYEMCILEVEGCAAMNSREVIRRLIDDGWFEVAQSGSHKQFKHTSKPGRVTVVYPKRDVPEGTLRSIEKQSGLRLR
jgi:predicted RNA binding protein YcfA (HicA-like mRNA interferase family)